MTILTKDCPNDILPEVLGILGNLNIPNFDFQKLIQEHKLVVFIRSLVKNPETLEDDIALNLMILFGSFLEDENTIKVITEKSFFKMVLDVLMAKQDDDEIVLQTVFFIYKILVHANGRKALLKNEGIRNWI